MSEKPEIKFYGENTFNKNIVMKNNDGEEVVVPVTFYNFCKKGFNAGIKEMQLTDWERKKHTFILSEQKFDE